jgi:hypothetical protein
VGRTLQGGSRNSGNGTAGGRRRWRIRTRDGILASLVAGYGNVCNLVLARSVMQASSGVSFMSYCAVSLLLARASIQYSAL